MKQSREFLQHIIDQMNEIGAFDSKVRDDGWVVTSGSRRYVAFNKYSRSRYAKVIYFVSPIKRQECLSLQLLIASTNPRVDDFRTSAAQNGEDFHSVFAKRCCGVERTVHFETGIDAEAAICKIVNELDALYTAYNAVVDIGRSPQPKGSCEKIEEVEVLKGQKLIPKYDLRWNGWATYYNKWDSFVKTWFDSAANPKDDLTQALETEGPFQRADSNIRLDKAKLPEPYYGNGATAKCVVVHLNPGTSSKGVSEIVLGSFGFLIRSFEADCGKKYSEFTKKWSPLKDSYIDKRPEDVPGYDWWHNANRKKFFKRFFCVQNLTDVFALEACPYHSKRWSGGLDAIEKHVIDNVITTAAVIAERNNNCAVLVGSVFNPVIARIKGVETAGRWRGTRVYSLYKLTRPIDGLNNRKPIFLLVVNGTQGMFLPRSNKSNIAIENIIHEIVSGSSCRLRTRKGE